MGYRDTSKMSDREQKHSISAENHREADESDADEINLESGISKR